MKNWLNSKSPVGKVLINFVLYYALCFTVYAIFKLLLNEEFGFSWVYIAKNSFLFAILFTPAFNWKLIKRVFSGSGNKETENNV